MADAQFSRGVELIHLERLRQLQEENYNPEHDDNHIADQLVLAAVCYATPAPLRRHPPVFSRGQGWQPSVRPEYWPSGWYWKPTPDNRVRELVKAGALIAAEIDRLTRA
jgi:hypothetical protein